MKDTLRSGYKQTEVGVIPEDWTATTIGDVASFSGGSQPPRHTFKFAPTKGYIRLIQIRDYKSDAFETYIPNSLAQKRCTANDIMIGRYGPPVFQILRGIDGAYNVALIKTVPSDRIDQEYFFYVLKQEKLFQLIDALSRRSSGQTGVEMPALKGYGLPLPPQPEQRAIAAALSDVDALLAKLDQLIAKKRDLKQVAMQQLLTGQTRLPGFSGAWDVKRLGDVCRIVTGKKDVNEGNPGGQFPFFTCARANTFSDSYSFEGEAILIAGNGEVGNLNYYKGRFEAYQRTYVLQGFMTEVRYLWHQLNAFLVKSLGIGTIGSSIPYIKMENLVGFEFRSPVNEVEQTAIATVLSDMDADIAALEARRDKTRALKQGMMQELLTGRIRLV
jgi:type I restriction enzyme S subunit